jgi:hypothetical protein
LFTSAHKGQRVEQIFELAETVYENATRRVKTSLVNEVMIEAFTLSPPPPIKNNRLKLLYATQVSVAPPTFILFVNNAKLMKDSYRRYIEKKLRENFEFAGTPLVVIPRSREEKAQGQKKRSPKKSVEKKSADISQTRKHQDKLAGKTVTTRAKASGSTRQAKSGSVKSKTLKSGKGR